VELDGGVDGSGAKTDGGGVAGPSVVFSDAGGGLAALSVAGVVDAGAGAFFSRTSVAGTASVLLGFSGVSSGVAADGAA